MESFRQNFRPKMLVPSLATGLVAGILEVPIEISFAALIFTGILTPYLSAGIGYMLMGAIILSLTNALLSALRGGLALPQDTSAVIIAAIAAGIAASMSDAPPDTIFLTLLATITATSILCGATLFALGWFRLGNFVRYIPYPVVGGFLAGTGLLLLLGGIGIAAGASASVLTLPTLFEIGSLGRWLPGLVFAVLLFITTRRISNPLTIPLIMLAAIGIFYAYLFALGSSVQEASQLGLLMGPFPEGNLWSLPPLYKLVEVDWGVVIKQAGQILSLVVISTISLLLNAGGLELVMRQEVDFNHELRVSGVGNIASGFVGSIPGYLALSLSALSTRMRANNRLVGIFTAGTICLAMLFGAPLIALFPRMVAGGLVAFLGISFLFEWVYESWYKLKLSDYLIVLIIMVTMGAVGPLAGVGLGLVLAAGLFIIQYSQTKIVKHILNGNTYQSKVERSAVERAVLRESGDWIEILELQGFIFFGTTQKLLALVHSRFHDPAKIPPRYLLLDFRQVTGMDASAVMSFVKLRTLTQAHPITLVFTHLHPALEKQLDRELRAYGEDICWMFFMDLDHGVEWCENQILQSAQASTTAGEKRPNGLAELFFASPENTDETIQGRFPLDRLLNYLERVELPAGYTLIHQGGPPQGIFLIESGQVTAQLVQPDGSTFRLRTMGPGTVVGELGEYLNIPATASVVTDQPSVIYLMSSERFQQLDEQDPKLAAAFHKFIARLVGDRLRNTLDTIRALSE